MFFVNHDSELMVQHVAAVAVPNSSLFFTVADKQGNPVVFSLGTDEKFYVIQNDAHGQKQLNDLGILLRLDASYVGHALSISQGPEMNLFLVLAIQSMENEGASEIIVLKPFQLSEYDLSSSGSDLSGLIIPQTGHSYNQRVKSFFSVGATGSSVYPPVLVAFQSLEYLNKKEDLEQVNVSNDLGSWDLRTDIDLPEDATKILALQPLAVPFGDDTMLGQAALYIIQDKVQLIFQSPTFQVTLQIPKNATSLGSVVSADGFTDLLIGGSGLYRLEARKCLYKDSEPTCVMAESFFSSISELHVGQSPQAVTVWAEASDETVGYITTDADFSKVQNPIPVLAQQQGGRFSVFKSPSLGQDQIIVSDSGGSLSLLRHDPQLGLWKPTSFYTPTLDKVVELKSYTAQIWVYNDDYSRMVDAEVLLQSSGYVDILMNGMPLQISPSGTPVVTDQDGLLTLIVPTDDISTYTFTVTSTEGASASDGAVVDPAVKVYDALSKIQTGDDLKNARLQNGDKLLENNSLDDYDLNETAQAIATAVSRRGATLARQNSVTTVGPTTPRQRSMFGKNKERFYTRGGFIDMLNDAWNWLKNVFKDITAWAIEATEEFCHFWVEVSGQAYRWILNTAEMIGQAISWIFEKILEIAEKIIEWIGFIFNWSDIKATHNSIVSLVNNALDAMAAKADLAPDAIEAYFDGFTDVIRSTCDGGSPDKIANAPADKSTARDNEITQRAAASTKVKWSHYQCTHGGAIQGSRVQSVKKLQSSDLSFNDFWKDVIAPLIDTFASMAKEAGLALFHLFDPADSITPGQTLSQLGSDLLLKLLDGIKRIARGLVSIGSTLIRDIKSAFNYKINIPIFSWLYKNVLSGNDLTVLDGFSLVVAIPVTVLTKIVTGERPADMTTLNYGDLMDGTADATQMMQFSQFASSSSICCRPFLAALELIETVFGAQARFQACHIKQTGRVQPLASGNDLVKKYWKDVFAVIVTVATIPFNPAETAYDLRWGSWAVCTVNRAVDMAIRRVTVIGPTKQALGMATIMLGSVNYGLVIAACVEEFQAPGNEEALVVLDCVSGTFDLVGTVCHGAAQLDVDSESAAALEVASTATNICAIIITGATYITRAAEGEYNYIISYL